LAFIINNSSFLVPNKTGEGRGVVVVVKS